jgi:RNA polymerase sigma-70 factor (ECF subfamily)
MAFEQLYRSHVGATMALCLRWVNDPAQAELLTQDIFVKVWEKLHTFRATGPFGAWLRRVAVNVIIEDRRKGARAAKWLDQGEWDESRAPAGRDSIDEAMDLEKAVAALPEGARAAFLLHDVYGYRHREIAELLGTAEGTAKAQLHRARTLLRQALKPPREI